AGAWWSPAPWVRCRATRRDERSPACDPTPSIPSPNPAINRWTPDAAPASATPCAARNAQGSTTLSPAPDWSEVSCLASGKKRGRHGFVGFRRRAESGRAQFLQHFHRTIGRATEPIVKTRILRVKL